MKKILATVLVLMLWLVYSGMALPSPDECFTYSCSPYYANPRTHTHGDWEVIYESKTTCKIYDLSEQGKELEVVVIPTEISGRKVVGFHTFVSKSGEYYHHISSENMKKLFLTEYIPCDESLIRQEGVRVFVLYVNDYDECPAFPTGCYVKRTVVDCYNGKVCDWDDLLKPSHLSYYYNYDGAPNQGYYWIDDYNNEIIKYKPSDPTREGYEFTGWYKEPECVNKWDFKVDIVPEKNFIKKYSTYIYEETALYAGWRKI